jgi:hypothetical protein
VTVNKLAKDAPRVRIGIEHESGQYGEHTPVGGSWEQARWRETITYKSICKTCRGSGTGSGCHEQGGWTMGLCPTCCGYGYSYSNAKPRGRWKKGPSPLYAGQ